MAPFQRPPLGWESAPTDVRRSTTDKGSLHLSPSTQHPECERERERAFHFRHVDVRYFPTGKSWAVWMVSRQVTAPTVKRTSDYYKVTR